MNTLQDKTRLVIKLIKLKKKEPKIYISSFPMSGGDREYYEDGNLKFKYVKVIASGKGGDPPSLSPPTHALSSISTR